MNVTYWHIQKFPMPTQSPQEQVVLLVSTRQAAAVSMWHVSTPVEARINASEAGERCVHSAERLR